MNRDTLKKGYYLARNKTEKWFFVPWDYDATFGMLWDGSPYTTTSWWDPEKNNLIRRLSESTATGFNARVNTRWAGLRATLFTEDAIMNRFIAYRNDAVPVPGETENARARNFARWPESGGEGVDNPELGTLEYIRDWLRGRIEFLDEQFVYQPLVDNDNDGVADVQDNCTLVSNTDQRDTNGDGYGNICDADLDNDGTVNLSDYSSFRSAFGGTAPLTPAQEDADFNGDGNVNLSDYSIFRSYFGQVPGPSCCAP
jgi:hypothetical protein